MYLLDTDYVSLITRNGAEGKTILARLATVPAESVAVCILSYEEQMRGWMAELALLQGVDRQMAGYRRLEQLREYYCAAPAIPAGAYVGAVAGGAKRRDATTAR